MTAESKINDRIAENLKTLGDALSEFMLSVPLSRSWIEYAWPISVDNPARPLLAGAKIALLESGTSWGLGSNRGAAASLRTYIENSLGWLYYKDHPVEYRVMAAKEDDLLLPKAVKSYLQRINRGYEKAYATLAATASRPSEYFYTEVSQFVHAHPVFANLGTEIATIVIAKPRDKSFLKISKGSDEFISDVYSTYYRHNWESMAPSVQDDLKSRLKSKLAKFMEI
jgi:hypothetical protein